MTPGAGAQPPANCEAMSQAWLAAQRPPHQCPHDPHPPPALIRNIAETEKTGWVERASKSRKAGCGGLFGFTGFTSVGSLAAVARNCRGGCESSVSAVATYSGR